MFLFFFPGRSGQDANYLREVGLDELAGESPEFLFTDRGPSGSPGVLCRFASPLRPDQTPSWDVAAYDWTDPDAPIAGRQSPTVMFGRTKSAPLTPAMLERRKLRPGALVRLADGQQWQIPIARQLPRVLGRQKASRPTDAYKPFWDLATRAVEEWLLLGDRGPVWSTTDEQLFDFACAALAINYRLAPALVDWLGLIDTDCAFEVVNAVTEGQCLGRLLELEKKRAATQQNPSPSDSTPASPCSAAGGQD